MEQVDILMPCRIGITITTDLQSQKAYWEANSNNLHDWRVIAGPYSSRVNALEEASRLAILDNCDNATRWTATDDPSAEWWVFRFTHDGWN